MGAHILISFLFYNIILFGIIRRYKRGLYYIEKRDLIWYVILFIAFGTYGGGEGDYLHLKERMELYQTVYDVLYYDMMEVQYGYLAYLLNCNYHLWRLVIFSVQFIGMGWFMYKAKLNTYPILLCFVSLCLVSSVYGRAFWGLIYFFLGFYLLLEKKNPLFIIAILLCFFSHKQNVLLLSLLPLGFIDLKKWQLLFVLIIFSTLVVILKDNFISFLGAGIEDEYLNKKAIEYEDSTLSPFGGSILERTMFVLKYVPIAIVIISIIITILRDRHRYLSYDKPFRGVMNISIGVVFVSLLFLFSKVGGGVFFYRILGMVVFPIALIVPYLRSCKSISRQSFNLFVKCAIICTEIGYFKDVYYAIAGGAF